jgi:hypothetical protein
MPLLRPSPSRQIWKAYEDGLEEMIELDRSPTGLPEGLPQPVYVLHSSDIAGGKGLTAATHTAWRFYRGSFAGPAVSLEVGKTEVGKTEVGKTEVGKTEVGKTEAGKRQLRMTSLSDGHSVQVAFQQISLIERLPKVRIADYELRRLKIPGMLTAFWLKSHIEGKDLLVLIAGKLHGLKYMKPYPAEKFLAILRPIAQARQQANDEPRK